MERLIKQNNNDIIYTTTTVKITITSTQYIKIILPKTFLLTRY